jgi:hypothetical protein
MWAAARACREGLGTAARARKLDPRASQVLFSKFVNKAEVTTRTSLGTVVAVSGTVCTVAFGPNAEKCCTLDELAGLWTRAAWWAYIGVTAVVAGASWYLYVRQMRLVKQRKAPRSGYVLPVTFAVTTSLMGGSQACRATPHNAARCMSCAARCRVQMIVHSKAIAELFKLIFSYNGEGVFPMAHWYFWVEFLLLASCGIFWLGAMNHSLGVFDPLFIIPLMQASVGSRAPPQMPHGRTQTCR